MASGMYMGKLDGVHDTKYVCIFILGPNTYESFVWERIAFLMYDIYS